MVKKQKLFLLLFIIVLMVGVGVRVYYIYRLPPCMPEDDSSTIGLMAIDILKGKIPVFFSGQDFTGSLEAVWVSLFVAVLGMSTATLYLGMISQYVVFALTLFWLGRILGGRLVGLFALAYCSIPPYFFLYESVVPYGYHMVLPIFGNLILICTLLLTAGRKDRFILWAGLGFSAGIGLWIHFSIINYIIPAGIYLLLNKKIITLIKNSLTVIVFFIIGGLPFWAYNLFTNFSSFNLYDGRPYRYQDIGLTYYGSFKRVMDYHLPAVLGIRDICPLAQKLAWIIFGVLIAIFIKSIWKSKRILLLFLFITVILIFSSQKYFSRSPYSYYAVSLYSVIPIMIAYSLDWLNKKLKHSGTIFLIAILAFNANVLSCGITLEVKNISDRHKNWMEYIHFLTSKGIDSFYGHFTVCQPINYLTKNKILGAEIVDGRPPTDLELAARDRIAIHGIAELIPALKMVCKDFKNDYGFSYAFKEYGYYGKAISPVKFYGSSNYNTDDAKYGYDRNLDKRWFVEKNRKIKAYYQLDLGSLYKVYKIVIFPYTWDFPISFKIKVSVDGINWQTQKRSINPHPLFWSGPRLYWDCRYGRQEIIFRPIKARYVRIEETMEGFIDWGINEVFVFKYLGQKENKIRDYVKPAKQVYGHLLKNKIKFTYADFWLSAKIRKWSKDKIASLQIENMCYPLRKNTSRIMKITRNTAVVVNDETEIETERILNEFNIPIKKKTIGDYTVFLFEESNWSKYFFKHEDNLYWAGICPVKRNLILYSRILYGYGMKLEKEGDISGAINYYKKALKIYPRNILAGEKVVGYYKNKGSFNEYKKQLLKLKHFCPPQIRKEIKFKNGVTFLGYRIFGYKNVLRIDYYWKIDKKLKDYTVVFVHFIKDRKIVFQGDYPLFLEYSNSIIPIKDWIFVERSKVKIPYNAESGSYEIVAGLYLPHSGGKRIRMKTGETKIAIGTIDL